MNWTTKKPQKPGWYWVRVVCGDGTCSIPEAVELSGATGDLFMEERGHDRIAVSKLPVSYQFAGPIPEPSENPVDVIEPCVLAEANRLGVEVDEDSLTKARAYCGEPALVVPVSVARAIIDSGCRSASEIDGGLSCHFCGEDFDGTSERHRDGCPFVALRDLLARAE